MMPQKRCGHSLIAVYRSGTEMEETVIRWCSKCGAIVGDIDVDGRTSPGDVFPMRLPRIAEEQKE